MVRPTGSEIILPRPKNVIGQKSDKKRRRTPAKATIHLSVLRLDGGTHLRRANRQAGMGVEVHSRHALRVPFDNSSAISRIYGGRFETERIDRKVVDCLRFRRVNCNWAKASPRRTPPSTRLQSGMLQSLTTPLHEPDASILLPRSEVGIRLDRTQNFMQNMACKTRHARRATRLLGMRKMTVMIVAAADLLLQKAQLDTGRSSPI